MLKLNFKFQHFPLLCFDTIFTKFRQIDRIKRKKIEGRKEERNLKKEIALTRSEFSPRALQVLPLGSLTYPSTQEHLKLPLVFSQIWLQEPGVLHSLTSKINQQKLINIHNSKRNPQKNPQIQTNKNS